MISFSEIVTSLEIGLLYGVVAIGIYFSFRIINFTDLTCDGSFVAGAAISSVLIKQGYNPWLALCAAFVLGGLAGSATAILANWCNMSEILSGILVAFMLYSVNLKILNGSANLPLFNSQTIFSSSNSLAIAYTIALVVIAICTYLLRTDFGLALRSVGQNKNLAATYGINVNLMNMIGLMLSNALIGIGGAAFSQHQQFADLSQGAGTVIIGLVAVIIGEKILPSRSTTIAIISCVVGSIVYRLLIALALHSDWLGLQSSDLNLITGLLVILVMGLPAFKTQRSGTC